MPRLTMTAFVTLDGVMQSPGGLPARTRAAASPTGGWVVPYVDP